MYPPGVQVSDEAVSLLSEPDADAAMVDALVYEALLVIKEALENAPAVVVGCGSVWVELFSPAVLAVSRGIDEVAAPKEELDSVLLVPPLLEPWTARTVEVNLTAELLEISGAVTVMNVELVSVRVISVIDSAEEPAAPELVP